MKPKYNIGDKVWRISNGKAVEGTVTGVIAKEHPMTDIAFWYSTHLTKYYDEARCELSENELFATREDLIASL